MAMFTIRIGERKSVASELHVWQIMQDITPRLNLLGGGRTDESLATDLQELRRR
jgi:hypothetical protein